MGKEVSFASQFGGRKEGRGESLLPYASARLQGSRAKVSLGTSLAGTLLNYAAVVGVLIWSGIIIDHIVSATGGAGLVWVSPKLRVYEHQALGIPGNVGIACVLSFTAFFTCLLVRQRARIWMLIAFVLLNLFALVGLMVLLDFGAVEHGLHP